MTPLEELSGLRGLARALAGSDADADDLMQDAALAVLERKPEARELRPYLAAVLRNRWRMNRRAMLRRRARELAVEPLPPDELRPDCDVERMLAPLPESYRALVIARYFEGKTSPELARELGIPAITVRTRLSRALAMIRSALP